MHLAMPSRVIKSAVHIVSIAALLCGYWVMPYHVLGSTTSASVRNANEAQLDDVLNRWLRPLFAPHKKGTYKPIPPRYVVTLSQALHAATSSSSHWRPAPKDATLFGAQRSTFLFGKSDARTGGVTSPSLFERLAALMRQVVAWFGF